ncbi:MAG: hypothetical protein JJE42_09590 [Burkholderiales bacterium]|nr:hypothetical protein [Burkholderiales bacterium]
MSADKLSAREAALIAQARVQLGKAPPARADSSATVQVARVKRTVPAAPAPESARSAPGADPAERLAALMAAARAESERQRERQRRLYLWAPLGFISVAGLWVLAWMWHRL